MEGYVYNFHEIYEEDLRNIHAYLRPTRATITDYEESYSSPEIPIYNHVESMNVHPKILAGKRVNTIRQS